jgi:hypothetical protein
MRAYAAVASVVLLAGCGGTADDQPDDAPISLPAGVPTERLSRAERELATAYRAFVDAFLSGDGTTAYDLLSERCQGVYSPDEYADGSADAAEEVGLVDYVIVSVTVDGDRGEVDGEFPVAELNHDGGTALVLEDGRWRVDRCE